MQKSITGKILLPFAVAALLSACGGDGDDDDGGGPGPTPGTTGTLNLTVNGVDGDGDVVAQNAQGAQIPLEEGANTLTKGTYTLVVNGIREDGAIVDSLLAGSAAPATVTITADETTNATATYATGLAGRLWVPVATTLHGYDETELSAAAGDTDGGSVTITGAGTTPFNVAFDASGNMWVADGGADALLFYSVDQLGAPGSGPPDATINADSQGSLNVPVGLAFDGDGNLWVGNFSDTGAGANTLVQYSAATLAAAVAAGTSAPSPDITIDSPDLNGNYGHAFDDDGNLWVANNRGNTLVRFDAASLVDGTVPADQTVTAKGTGNLAAPRSPAVDADGNLWVSSRNSDQVVRYTIDPATGDAGSPLDVNVFLANGTTAVDPTGLAFDNAGDLWIADSVNDAVVKYTAADLTDGGSASAATALTGAGNISGVLIGFNPPPDDLPLAQ